MKKLCFIMVVAMLGASATRAASVYREDFADGLAGWENGNQELVWTAQNGYLRVTLPGGDIPSLDSPILAAGAAASGGAFSGDYRAAGIRFIGFDLLAENVLPAAVAVDLVGAGRRYRTYVTGQVSGVGTVSAVVVPLPQGQPVDWELGLSEAEAFAATLAAVERLEIRILQAGRGAQAYQLDNVFLQGAPAGGGLTVDPVSGSPAMVWQAVLPGARYQLQMSEDLMAPGGGWMDIEGASHTAEDTLLQVPMDVEPSSRMRYFRLKME
jgi:hypothetical protein